MNRLLILINFSVKVNYLKDGKYFLYKNRNNTFPEDIFVNLSKLSRHMLNSNPSSMNELRFPFSCYSEDTAVLRYAERSEKQGIIFGFVLLYLKTAKM